MSITLTLPEFGFLAGVLISVGGLVVYIKQSQRALTRAFARIERIEQILLAEGFMAPETGTQTGKGGRGIPRPHGLPTGEDA